MSKQSTNKSWVTVNREMSQKGIEISFQDNRQYALAKDQYAATLHDNFLAVSLAIRDRLVERWIVTQQGYHKNNLKRVYYLSMEFLIGRLLGNNILNLGLTDQAYNAMEDLGLDPNQIVDQESDAGLGNGGLGRLAACFLDSMATLAIPAYGYGIRYDYGIFNQKIIDGYQVESPDEWLKLGNPWEFCRPEYTVKIRFYGKTRTYQDRHGRLRVHWADTKDVLAVPYDMPVPGYKNDVINTLRLWSARSAEEFDFEYFNDGDYERAVYNQVISENISKVLYPNDIIIQGKELRLQQEYFFTAASISDIIRRFKVDNNDIRQLHEKAAIQLNDTHPALAIVELMRILVDEEEMEWDAAWHITVNTCAYTNHTMMPEALESWSVELFEKLLPRHLQLIYEINRRFLREVANRYPWDILRQARMSIIEEGNPKHIRMAYLSIIGSHSVNGVSPLHSELIKNQLFKDFNDVWPEKFNNKTNGVTQRRWLAKANPRLADLITSKIGDNWISNLTELDKLTPLCEDAEFRQQWQAVKARNKQDLAAYIKQTTAVSVNPDSLFDVQVKRIHEYKRQFMFGLYIIRQYLKIKKDPNSVVVPRTFIFSGKAAPGYFMAKLIIKFINRIADIVNNDRGVKDLLKVVFLENYRVSLAERIFPASDLSEQISTAGTEASGTGCMKFMMNGALTIGTLDGANIDIKKAAGDENIFIFGLREHEVQELKRNGYYPPEYINRSPMLKAVLDLIKSHFFCPLDPELFDPLINSLINQDYFMVCADFDAYCAMQDKVSEAFKDQETWLKKSIVNVAKSGEFSSDNSIARYAQEIWQVPYRIAANQQQNKDK
ncbi:MAG: glycogen/starch/alpha-glucan phosphorylase [Candidatus Omnitrophica bacterium]|nr:glycogen/starch/alpha-glucan phosphorylase [Candidatus Omnitrophota bacterium]